MKHQFLLACAIPAVLLASPALAQQAPAADAAADSGVADIVVTAQKREQNLQSVPVSVTAVTSQTLESRQIVSAVDLQRTTPGLTFGNTVASQFTWLVNIRGQQTIDATAMLDPSVGIYVDGVYLPTTRGFGAEQLVDVERVEVLKGPQGTLYGRNTTGGAISIVSKKPTDDFEGMVRGTIGNFGTHRVAGVLNLPISAGWALRLVGQWGESDGWTRNAFLNRKVTNTDGYTIRGTLKGELSDNVDLLLRGDWSQGNGGGQAQLPMYLNACNSPATGGRCAGVLTLANLASVGTPGAEQFAISNGFLSASQLSASFLTADPNNINVVAAALDAGAALYNTLPNRTTTPQNLPVYKNVPESESYKSGGVSMELSAKLGNGTLKITPALRYFQLTNRQDVDATTTNILDVTKVPSSAYQVTQEIQYTGNAFADKLEYVLGGYVYWYDGRDDVDNISLPSLNPANPSLARARIGKRSFSGYGQATYEVLPDTHITGGLRFTSERRKLELNSTTGAGAALSCSLPAALLANAVVCDVKLQHDESNWSWKVGADHRFSPELFVYGNISRGYKSGGFNQGVNKDANSANYYLPEVVTQYEIGFKADLLDRKVRLNGAAYTTNVSGLQRQIVTTVGGTGAPVNRIQNAASARIQGFEFEAVVAPVTGLSLSGTVGYTDTKYKQYLVTVGGTTTDKSAQPFRMIPKWTYSLAADYRMPVSFGTVSANVNWSGRGESFLNPEGDLFGYARTRQGGYGLLGAKLGVKVDATNTEISVWGNNLTDKRYWMTIAALDSLGFQTGAVGTPRTYGVTLTQSF